MVFSDDCMYTVGIKRRNLFQMVTSHTRNLLNEIVAWHKYTSGYRDYGIKSVDDD